MIFLKEKSDHVQFLLKNFKVPWSMKSLSKGFKTVLIGVLSSLYSNRPIHNDIVSTSMHKALEGGWGLTYTLIQFSLFHKAGVISYAPQTWKWEATNTLL